MNTLETLLSREKHLEDALNKVRAEIHQIKVFDQSLRRLDGGGQAMKRLDWLVVHTIAAGTYCVVWYALGRKRMRVMDYTYAEIRESIEEWLENERHVWRSE